MKNIDTNIANITGSNRENIEAPAIEEILKKSKQLVAIAKSAKVIRDKKMELVLIESNP